MAKLRVIRPAMKVPGFTPGMRDRSGRVLTAADFQQLSARIWSDVTGGAGVTLANGKPVELKETPKSP